MLLDCSTRLIQELVVVFFLNLDIITNLFIFNFQVDVYIRFRVMVQASTWYERLRN